MRAIAIAIVLACLATASVLAEEPQLPPLEAGPKISEQILEFAPGSGREPREFPLYELAESSLPYMDLWDLSQMLQASRYFDPVTRKVLLRIGERRVKLTDGLPYAFFDGRARELAEPCRIVAGRFYLPLDLWPALLAEFPDLPLQLDPDALRVIAGPGAPNLLGLEWVHARESLRVLLRTAGELEPSVLKLGEGWLQASIPGGRLADYPWTRLPVDSPLDSFRVSQSDDIVLMDFHLSQPIRDFRHRRDSEGRSWVLTVDLPLRPTLPEPPLGETLPEDVPPPALPGGFTRIVLDPGHGGADRGCITPDGILEKDWSLQAARWLAPFLEEQGFQVVWTRQRDEAHAMSHRSQAANVAGGDLYLSLHWTRRSRGGPTGMEIILEEPGLAESGEGLQAWEAVQGAHRRASLELGLDIQRELRPMGDWRQLGIRRENSAVLQGLDMPALMLELGNLDSGVERAAWEDPPTRARRLRALAEALARESARWEKEGRP